MFGCVIIIADMKVVYRSRTTTTSFSLWLFRFCKFCCNILLWESDTEFQLSLQFLYEVVAVNGGRHPRGSNAVTAICRTPRFWRRFRFVMSWLTIEVLTFTKTYHVEKRWYIRIELIKFPFVHSVVQLFSDDFFLLRV